MVKFNKHLIIAAVGILWAGFHFFGAYGKMDAQTFFMILGLMVFEFYVFVWITLGLISKFGKKKHEK